MNKVLGPTSLAEALAPSIKSDPAIQAAAGAVDGALRPVVQAIPRMLLRARLWRDESRLSPSLRRIVQFCGGLPPLSDDELELLAWQMHVDFWNPAWPRQVRENLVKYSTAWHRLKGTPAGIYAALELFGYKAQIEEDGAGTAYWASYQLGLPTIADEETVKHIVAVCTEMAPARCKLWRIYTDVYDRRPIILSHGPKLGEGWLSFYSGTPVELDDGTSVIVSFGTKNSFQASPFNPGEWYGASGLTDFYAFLAPYLDRFIVGRSRLSDKYPRNNPFVITSLFSILWAERATVARSWRGEWDARSWRDYTGFDRKLPRWIMRKRDIDRAQLVPGWGETLGDCNARLGATFATVIDNPMRVGEFALSGHDSQRRELRLHEMAMLRGGMQTAQAIAPGKWLIPADEIFFMLDGNNEPKPLKNFDFESENGLIPGAELLFSVASDGEFQTAFSALLSMCPHLPNPERAVSAAHFSLSMRMSAPNLGTPVTAGGSVHSTKAAWAGPTPESPTAFRSYQALGWQGAWKDAGRTWKTTINTVQ